MAIEPKLRVFTMKRSEFLHRLSRAVRHNRMFNTLARQVDSLKAAEKEEILVGTERGMENPILLAILRFSSFPAGDEFLADRSVEEAAWEYYQEKTKKKRAG